MNQFEINVKIDEILSSNKNLNLEIERRMVCAASLRYSINPEVRAQYHYIQSDIKILEKEVVKNENKLNLLKSKLQELKTLPLL